MHWFDWMCLVVVLGGAIIQTIRTTKAGGMGLTLVEMLGLVASAVAATKFSPPLAQLLKVTPPVTLIVLFIGFAVLSFTFARWFFGLTGWSFESLDGFLGFIWGFVTGWVIAYMILRVMVESQGPNGAITSTLPTAPIAREVFYFKTWNAILHLLFKVRLGPEFNPDVG